MRATRRELKSDARALLAGRYGTIIGAFLLTQLLILIVSSIFTQTTANRLAFVIALASSLILTLLSSILDAGFTYLYLQIARNREAGFRDVFHWFVSFPDKVICITLALFGINLALAAALFALLFIALQFTGNNAVQILGRLGSQVWMLLQNGILSEPLFAGISRSALPVIIAVLVLWLAAALAVNFRYVLVYHIFCDDPEESSISLLKRSRSLMQGNRLRLAVLLISFLGFALLGIISLGVGLLWVIPYVNMTVTVLYLNLLKESAQIHA